MPAALLIVSVSAANLGHLRLRKRSHLQMRCRVLCNFAIPGSSFRRTCSCAVCRKVVQCKAQGRGAVFVKAIFVRHGKDPEGYRGGWSNLDLTPQGVDQAKRLAEYLKENQHRYQISAILSSDLQRAMTTATFAAQALDLKIQKEPRLRETNNGDLAGMLNETALRRYPGLFFSTLEMDEAYPNGESPRAFYERIKKWFEDFCVQNHGLGESVLIVTHGGVINVLYHLLKGIEWSNKRKPFKADYCSVHVLNMDTMTFEAENITEANTLSL